MKYTLGRKVKVLEPGRNSILEKDDIGIIIEWNKDMRGYRVVVEGRGNYANWIGEDDMELVEMTGEDVQAYLKLIGMEDQMLRQLIMTMPIDDMSYYYAERIILERAKSNNYI